MKHLRWALGLVAAVGAAASAQTVTLYGLVDVAAERVQHVGADGSSLSRMPSLTGSVPSRLGIRASEGLGGGLRAVLTLEQGIFVDNGTLAQGGRSFGRQAFVGLAGPWGTVSLGRQYTMLFWALLDADILGPNIYGSGSLDAYIPNARSDNTLAYRGNWAGFTAGATYSLGRDTVNAAGPSGTNCAGEQPDDAQACRGWSVLLKYDSASWGAALAEDRFRGGAGAFAGLTRSDMTDTRRSLNGYVKFGDVKLGAGLIRRDNEGSAATPRSDLWYLGAAWAVTPLLSLEAEWLKLDFKGSTNQATLGAARATYSLSRRTALYATLGRIANDGKLALSVSAGAPGSNPAAGVSQLAATAGVRHAF
jgi:predicted porin